MQIAFSLFLFPLECRNSFAPHPFFAKPAISFVRDHSAPVVVSYEVFAAIYYDDHKLLMLFEGGAVVPVYGYAFAHCFLSCIGVVGEEKQSPA